MASRPAAGQTLGHYRIEERLGEGAIGVVFRAYDTRLDRRVALKLLGDPAGSASGEQLLQEARSAFGLYHPNICTIHDVGEIDQQPYIVMEHVAGRTLSSILKERRLPLETALRYGHQIASGLAHAHQHGILHCDLKPSNVVITEDDQPKLLDFGFARRLRDHEKRIKSSTMGHDSVPIVGTLHYMAPEILQGKPADARSDIWSLGVLLYEVITGELPFSGEAPLELAASILRDPPRSMPEWVPARVRAIVEKCLAKPPAARYQQVEAVVSALEVAQMDVQHPSRTTSRAWRNASLAFALAAVLFIGWLLWPRPRVIDSVAVLPFRPSGNEVTDEALAEILPQNLINALARVPATKVISWSSVGIYRGRDVDARRVAREQGVEAVLFGRVEGKGDSVRISVELVSGKDNAYLWGSQFSGGHSVNIQQELTRALVTRLRPELPEESVRQIARQATSSRQAYDYYSMGRHHWNQRTVDGIQRSIGYFQQAIQADPDFALAYTGLADAYTMLSSVSIEALPPRETMPKAKQAARKALELDDSLAEAHASLAHVLHNYDWDWEGAEREFRRAIELNPNYAEAHHWYAHYLMQLGRIQESLDHSRLARSLARTSLSVNNGLARQLYLARHFDEALAQADATLELDPNYIGARAIRGMIYEGRGRTGEALQEFQSIRRMIAASIPDADPDFAYVPFVHALLGHAHAVAGDGPAARRELKRLERAAKVRYVPAFYFAAVHAALGEHDRALAWLQKCVDERSEWTVYLAVEPILDKLRSDPRFGQLLQRARLRTTGAAGAAAGAGRALK